MKTYPNVPAAFINAISEEGTKEEAVRFLQEQWNETCYLRGKLRELEAEIESIKYDSMEGLR